MPAHDLLTALPGIVLAGVVPGYLLAAIIAPAWRWWEHLAVAPGLAAGLIGVLGLVDHDLGIRFEAATVMPVVAVLAALLVGRGLVRRSTADARSSDDAHRTPWQQTVAVTACALLAGAISVGVAAVGLSGEPLPVSDDGSVHAQVAEGIARTHDTLPLVPLPPNGSAVVRPRSGSEATAALVSELGGPSATRSMLPLALASVLVLPLGLAMLALTTTGSVRLAMLAPLAGVGAVLPLFPLGFAEFPLVTDSPLVAPLIVAVVRSVRDGAVRANAAVIAAIVASIWVVHGLEIITATVIAAPLVAGILISAPSRNRALQRLTVIVAVAAAAAIAVTLLTRLPAVPPPSGDQAVLPSEAERSVSSSPGAGVGEVIDLFRGSDLAGTLGLALFVIGCGSAILARRLRWALVSSIILLAALFDVVHAGWLHSLWLRVYPWAVLDRLVSVQYWTASLLVALGAETIIAAVAVTILRARQRGGDVLVWSAAAAIGVAMLAVGASQTSRIFGGVVADRSRVTTADIKAMDEIGQRLPSGLVVITDGEDDAGIWLSVLTPEVQFFTKPWMAAFPDEPRVVALQHACDDPVAARRALAGIDAVFVGAKHWSGATHPWDAQCIAALPGLTVVASVTDMGRTATVFRVSR
jgi:hypothetical protein